MRETLRPALSRIEKAALWVDAAIGFVAPAWGLSRVRARGMTKMFGAYRGAEFTRLHGDWSAQSGSADADLLLDLPTLRQRSRDLNRNDAHAGAITNTIVLNVVGTGLKPQARPDEEALGITPEEAKAFIKAAERVWRRWVPTADAQNRMNFYAIQALCERQILENGEVFVLRQMIQDESNRRYRLALEVIEADRVSTPPGKSGPNMRDGVELGDRGQPIAYWVRKNHPGDVGMGLGYVGPGEWTRYEAVNRISGHKNILHLYLVKRPGQTRGEPIFSSVLGMFKNLGDVIEAALVTERIAACFSAFIKKANPYGAAQANTRTDAAGNKLEDIQPGMISYLQPGEEIQFADPSRPGGTFDPFVQVVLRSICANLNLPLQIVLKDFSRMNYSSARTALIEARRAFKVYQTWLAAHLCQPVYEWLLEEAWLKQELPAVDLFGEQHDDWTLTSWIAPGWGWVDPVKEVESSTMAIAGGVSTLAEECAAQGRDWEDTMRQRKREIDLANELGLTPAVVAGPTKPQETQVEEATDESPVGR